MLSGPGAAITLDYAGPLPLGYTAGGYRCAFIFGSLQQTRTIVYRFFSGRYSRSPPIHPGGQSQPSVGGFGHSLLSDDGLQHQAVNRRVQAARHEENDNERRQRMRGRATVGADRFNPAIAFMSEEVPQSLQLRSYRIYLDPFHAIDTWPMGLCIRLTVAKVLSLQGWLEGV